MTLFRFECLECSLELFPARTRRNRKLQLSIPTATSNSTETRANSTCSSLRSFFSQVNCCPRHLREYRFAARIQTVVFLHKKIFPPWGAVLAHCLQNRENKRRSASVGAASSHIRRMWACSQALWQRKE